MYKISFSSEGDYYCSNPYTAMTRFVMFCNDDFLRYAFTKTDSHEWRKASKIIDRLEKIEILKYTFKLLFLSKGTALQCWGSTITKVHRNCRGIEHGGHLW